MVDIKKEDIEWLEGIEEIKKVSFKKGDTIVLMTNRRLTQAVYEALSTMVDNFIKMLGFDKNDLHFIVLDDGLKIGVLHKEGDF